MHAYLADLVKRAIKASPETCWALTKGWQAQWKMLVCSLDEVWSRNRRPAPQVARAKHLLCESSTGGCEVCLLCRSRWKNHTHAALWHVLTHVPTPTLRLSRLLRRRKTWCPFRVPFVVNGNSWLSLASRIFRSPVRVSDALLICQHLFLPTKAAAALFYPTLSPSMPTLPLAPGWAQLMSCQPLAAISAQSGWNPPPTSLRPSPQPLPDLRLPDTLVHTCFPF